MINIQKDTVYICTKGNVDISKGELFWIDSRDDTLVCPKAGGWLEKEESEDVLSKIIFEKSNDYVIYNNGIISKQKLTDLLSK